MTTQAASWSELELDDRFTVGEPYDELTELATTLNGLLDRIAASFRREQRFSAELSHELRTPLARVLAESELALRRERTPAEYRARARARPPQRRAAHADGRRARRRRPPPDRRPRDRRRLRGRRRRRSARAPR